MKRNKKGSRSLRAVGIPEKIGYSLDDVLLAPRMNNLKSRLDTNLRTYITKNWQLSVPILSTNMSTVTGLAMMKALYKGGGAGALHRFNRISEGATIVAKAKKNGISPIVASVGVGDHEYERTKALVDAGADIILIDIAHGHSDTVLQLLSRIKKDFSVDCIVGNIATAEAANDFLHAGADALRVGIGGGSRCTTRTVTGHGVPNLTALDDVVQERDKYVTNTGVYVPVIIDGGIKNSGDIVKSLYFGADVACIGNLFAGTYESPGRVITTKSGRMKKYYGMASKEAQENYRGKKRGTAAEGISQQVPYKGPVAPILEELTGGIRSGLTYSGARTINELRKNGKAMLLTPAAQGESKLR